MKRYFYLVLLAIGAASLFSGCATTKTDEESDIPWNAPQPWENSPGFLNGQ